MAQEIYAREWGVNANHYVTEGLYAALAAELVEAGMVERVLDIGCGLGQGLEALTAAILAKGRLIAGVDENPHCLAGAATRLGLPKKAIASPRVQSKLGFKLYDSVPATAPIVVQGGTVLVNADVLVADAAFERWLCQNGPFDAVSLWFTGGHKARSITKVAQRIDAQSDEDFRWAIEDKAMEIALRHLRPGGLIQLVIRASGDLETRRRGLEAHRRGAVANYPVELVAVRSYPYAEPALPGAIVVSGAGGALLSGQQMALSTLFRARDVSTQAATAELFKLVNRTPFNIAPERAEALAKEVFGTGAWTITPLASSASFWARVDEKAVYVTWAGLASLWCVAYVAYNVMQMGSMASRTQATKGAVGVDLGRQWHELNLQGFVDYAKRLVWADQSWSVGLPLPDAQAPAASHNGKINNLFFGALSWILLHEIGHVHHGHHPFLPVDQMVRQEVQADDFATTWVLDDAGAGLDREFRALMVITALAWLFLFESAGGQDPTHPPAILRFRAAAAKLNLGDRSPALENASYVLKAMFDPTAAPPRKRQIPREAFGLDRPTPRNAFPGSLTTIANRATCEGNVPADIAALRSACADVRVTIVGLSVCDPVVEAQLARWPAQGGGFYFSASDLSSLCSAIHSVMLPFQIIDEQGSKIIRGLVGPNRPPAGTYRIRVLSPPPQEIHRNRSARATTELSVPVASWCVCVIASSSANHGVINLHIKIADRRAS